MKDKCQNRPSSADEQIHFESARPPKTVLENETGARKICTHYTENKSNVSHLIVQRVTFKTMCVFIYIYIQLASYVIM